MKKSYFKSHFFVIIIGLLFLTGCGIPSVHPVYTPNDLVTLDQLEGVWQNNKGTKSYSIQQIATFNQELNDGSFDEYEEMGLGNAYMIQNLKKPEEFMIAGLIQIKDNYYIDIFRVQVWEDSFSYPTHIITKASIFDDEIILHMFSEEWLKQQIRDRQVRVRHEVNAMGNILITARTSELQQFITKYGDIEEAYAQSETFSKISNQPEFILELD